MAYEYKFSLVRQSFIEYCKERITENWERMFNMWLGCEADMEFSNGYKNKFKEQFSEYITTEVEDKLWLAGKNIVFAIGAFMSYKGDVELEELLEFTEMFVESQLDDFNNWCDDISSAMYEEGLQQNNEDNPS